MVYTSEMTDEQFEQNLNSVLQRELGAGGFARFLRLYRSGRGDYTRDRHQLLEGITLEQIFQDMEDLEKRS